MCLLLSRNAAQVFSVPNVVNPLGSDVWKCRINEGIAGMINAIWSPCSQYILTESDYGIHLCFWSLFEATDAVHQKSTQSKKGTGALLL